jgi:glutamine amidotransferase
MIGIVDYGMGNLLSVKNAFEYLGENVETISDPSGLEAVQKIVLPGVGAFGDCMKNLKEKGFVTALHHHVLQEKIPIMGICLGMQVMSKIGLEGGHIEGLGWFDAEVVKLKPSDKTFRVPHVGWTDIKYNQDSPLFRGLNGKPDFYFVHSYHVKCSNSAEVDACYDFGYNVTASIRKNNIFGTQVHPEKSQEHGLKVLENFINWKP